jgi:hypothetical protein
MPLKRLKNSQEMTTSDTSLHAQPTVELVSEHLSTSRSHYSLPNRKDSNRLPINITFKLEELMENILKAKMESMMSLIKEDSDFLNSI